MDLVIGADLVNGEDLDLVTLQAKCSHWQGDFHPSVLNELPDVYLSSGPQECSGWTLCRKLPKMCF